MYAYYFDWRSPVRGGKLGAFHTLEIPFAFENIDAGRSMTGSGGDRYALSDKMSGAWAAFARNGNPTTETCRLSMQPSDDNVLRQQLQGGQ